MSAGRSLDTYIRIVLSGKNSLSLQQANINKDKKVHCIIKSENKSYFFYRYFNSKYVTHCCAKASIPIKRRRKFIPPCNLREMNFKTEHPILIYVSYQLSYPFNDELS